MKIIKLVNLLRLTHPLVTESKVFYIFEIATVKPCLILGYHHNGSKNTHFSAQV